MCGSIISATAPRAAILARAGRPLVGGRDRRHRCTDRGSADPGRRRAWAAGSCCSRRWRSRASSRPRRDRCRTRCTEDLCGRGSMRRSARSCSESGSVTLPSEYDPSRLPLHPQVVRRRPPPSGNGRAVPSLPRAAAAWHARRRRSLADEPALAEPLGSSDVR